LPRLKPYRDASSFPSTFDLTIPACIHGLARNGTWMVHPTCLRCRKTGRP
jgi:hypothetical protein